MVQRIILYVHHWVRIVGAVEYLATENVPD